MEGRAMFTIEKSSTPIRGATARTARIAVDRTLPFISLVSCYPQQLDPSPYPEHDDEQDGGREPEKAERRVDTAHARHRSDAGNHTDRTENHAQLAPAHDRQTCCPCRQTDEDAPT